MANASNAGAFIPTTNIWDVSQVYAVQDISPQLQELLIRLYQNLNRMSIVTNIKDSGYYVLSEFVNGQIYFPNPDLNSTTAAVPIFRQVYRLVVNFGSLPNSSSKSVAHNIPITSATTFTRIYATSSDTIDKTYIPIPYASNTANKNIELSVDATNVIITTGMAWPNYDTTYVVLEYIKS